MMHDGYGFSAWGWFVMSMFWIVLIAAIVWAVARLFPSGGSIREPQRRETPEQILDRRLATGEIDLETYRALRAELEANRRVG